MLGIVLQCFFGTDGIKGAAHRVAGSSNDPFGRFDLSGRRFSLRHARGDICACCAADFQQKRLIVVIEQFGQ
jgi:hypothetical protein